MAEVSEGEGNANLLSLLEKLHLGYLLGNFECEKVTVDQICKLSDKQNNGMLRCKLSKHNDDCNVKVSNI